MFNVGAVPEEKQIVLGSSFRFRNVSLERLHS